MAADLFPDSPRMITIDDQIACAERELRMRHEVFPRLVADRKLSEAFAAHQIAAMEAIVETLRQQKERGIIATRIASGGQ